IPGDNEWTDCHRNNNGFYNPQERLGYLRSVFYPSNLSLGQKSIALTRQAGYPENVTWRYGNIVFVGLNQPGSNNNHQRNLSGSSLYPMPRDDNETEYASRNAANISWINSAFDAAASDPNTKAVVIMQQANVFERFLEPNQGYTESGYAAFVTTLRNRTVAFGKPVVLVGGDTHTIRIDKPLTTVTVTPTSGSPYLSGYPGHLTGGAIATPTTLINTVSGALCTPAGPTCVAPARVQNFIRVEVFGSPDVAWVRAVVDPFDPNVFSFATQTIPGTGHGRDGRTDDDDLQ
ncbi:MAG: hypothetical protein ACRD8O_13575, partial [Bryobacteraceae bacterium]